MTFEHLHNQRPFTMACCRAAGLSSLNEAERVNGAETRSVQKGKLKQAVLLDSDASLPRAEVLAVRQPRFQSVLANAIAGATYSKKPIISLMSHPGVEGSDTFSQDFRMYCRIVLDGTPEELPLSARFSIANALRYHELHHAAGFFDFQLRRMACVRHLNRLCTAADYSSPPSFQICSDLSISNDAVSGFLNDPIYAEDGNFMSPDSVEEERQKKGVPVLKVDPPSVHCKNLYRVTQHPTEKQMEDLAQTALGNVSKVAQIAKWFAHRRSLEFLKSEAR